MVGMLGWSRSVFNHISVRLPGDDDRFLLNPFPYTYDEITASKLICVDVDGNVVDGSTDVPNRAGFIIHGAIHAARPDVKCVLHAHTPSGIAVSAMQCGLLPLCSEAACFYEMIGYHDMEGIVLDLDERARLVQDIGDKPILILRNHGLLTAAPSIPAAFSMMWILIDACEAQIRAFSTGQPLTMIPPDVARKTARQRFRDDKSSGPWGSEWPAMLRKLDRLDPSYKT
jgi:ribulose-5-phosphate 4-epimerase/fuculose-1-phosphate aldolase